MATKSKTASTLDETGQPLNITYAEAMAELETLLEALHADDIDIDTLSKEVARAAVLLRFCKERIEKTKYEVETIVAELESE